MNKAVGVVGVALLLAAGYGGATAWVGQKAQLQQQEWMTKAEARVPFMQVTDRQYKRSFFSAVSTTTFSLGCASDGKNMPSVTVMNTIHHGPIADGTLAAAVIDSQVSISGDVGQKVQAMFNGSPITAHTVVGFGGGFKSTLSSPPAKLTLADGTELAWLGLSGTVDSAGSAGTTNQRVRSPGFTVDNARLGLHVKMTGLEIEADKKSSPGAGMIPAGTARGALEAFEVTGPMPSSDNAVGKAFTMSLTGLKFNTDTSIAGDLLESGFSLAGAGAFGDARFENFTMQGAMKRIHAPTYQHLMEAISSANSGCGAASKTDPMLLLQKTQGDLQTLLQYNPEFAIDKLAVDHAGEHGELSYSVGVQGVTAADAKLPMQALLMSRGQLKIGASVPVAWIRQAARLGSATMQRAVPDPAVVDVMIDKAVGEGFLIREGELVKGNIEYANGKATVNGHEVPLGGSREPANLRRDRPLRP